MSTQQKKSERSRWGSSLGFVLAAAGSAVGLGNIWKFPGRAYANGGGTFLLLYIIIVALIGTTVMLAELSLGRSTQSNTVGAFKKIRPRWKWIGGIGVLAGFIVTSYYIQVGGWVLNYIFAYITDAQAVYADPLNYFYNMLGANGFPLLGSIIFPLIFFAIAILVLLRGTKGIESFNKIAMPVLVVLLIVLLIRSVSLPGASEGIAYLLHFDWHYLTAETMLAALGQAFFSLSLGMAIMITYGSYLHKEEHMTKNVGFICTFDTLIAIIAAFVIIPAVFATGVEPGIGGGFAFASLAGVFEQMPFGTIFGCIFYILIFCAAITSVISLFEGTIAYVSEEWNIPRNKTIFRLAIALFLVSVLYTLSQVYLPLKVIWFDIANGIQTPSLADFMEFLTDRLLIPLGAFFTCIFVGWIWKPQSAIEEVEQNGSRKFRCAKLWTILIKFVAPLCILAIMVSSMVFGMALS